MKQKNTHYSRDLCLVFFNCIHYFFAEYLNYERTIFCFFESWYSRVFPSLSQYHRPDEIIL